MIPRAIRRLTPDRIRNDPRLRALAVGSGLIPPRTMHSRAEAQLLGRLARGRSRAVEIGVYEGSSAIQLCEVLAPGAELHLIDPFGHHPDALRSGWGATESATRRVVGRATRGSGPRVTWHVDFSANVAQGWNQEVDFVFIDGDHSEAGCRLDWDLWHRHVAPGGFVLFHDARAGRPGGGGLSGPTAVVDSVFRSSPPPGWEICDEVDTMVAVRRLALTR